MATCNSIWQLVLLLLLVECGTIVLASVQPQLCPSPPQCGTAGYEDRLFTFDFFATLANFVCARLYTLRPWAVLTPAHEKNFRYVNKSLDWIDFFAHDESYCGEENLPRSFAKFEFDSLYEENKKWVGMVKARPVVEMAVNLQKNSGYGHFDILLDDNDKAHKQYKKTIINSLKRVLETRKTNKSFLWSVHTHDLYDRRPMLAKMFEEMVYISRTSISDYTTRYVQPKRVHDVADAFLLQHNLVKNKFIVMHIRRADEAIKYYKCKKATPEDIAQLITKFTMNCGNVFPPGYTVAFHTDEHDSIFLNEVAVQIRKLGYVPFHVDSILKQFIEDHIKSGQLDVMHRNNYFMYGVILCMRERHQWLLDIHRPKNLDVGLLTGTCEKSYWDPATCVPYSTSNTREQNYDKLWMTFRAYVPPNRSIVPLPNALSS